MNTETPLLAATDATLNSLMRSFTPPHQIMIGTPVGWVSADTKTGEITMLEDGSPAPQEAIDDVKKKLGLD